MKTAPSKIKSASDSRQTKTGLTIKPWMGSKGLAEIYQSMAVRLALLRKLDDTTFEQITPFVNCYDFLCDVYSSTREKTNFSTYGFSWKGTHDVPDLTGIYLNIMFPSAKAKEDFKKNMQFLHDIEKKNNMPLTEFHDLGTQSGVSIGNLGWMQNCLTLRLYLFLFRALSYTIKTDDWIAELGKQGHSDSHYIKHLNRESWDKILGDLSSIHTDYFCGLSFKKDGTGAVHHNSGFFSTFSSHSEMSPHTVKSGKHWREMKKRGFKLFTE